MCKKERTIQTVYINPGIHLSTGKEESGHAHRSKNMLGDRVRSCFQEHGRGKQGGREAVGTVVVGDDVCGAQALSGFGKNAADLA